MPQTSCPKPTLSTEPRHSARGVAADLLDAVLLRRQPLDDAWESHPALDALAPRDRAFARLLAATALRRLGQIDALIDRCLERPLSPKAGPVRNVLRLGLVQLLFLQTPPHAAVDTSVALAGERGFGGFRNLVNAVLRRLQREGAALLAEQDAVRLNTPAWLWDSWAAAYGEATARRIGEAHLAEPPLDVTVKSDPEAWAKRLSARLLPTGSLRRETGGAIADLPGFAEGAWWVQDAAAALPARLLGDVRGGRVADLCAAPGGKTAQLAAAGAAEVAALDRAAKRLDRLRENMNRLGLKATPVVADAAVWRPEAPLDAVLLDAPCSATGTLRRQPDVAWLKQPSDVARLTAAQTRLLEAAVALVRPGGTLIYCACSLQPEEGIERIEALLASGAAVRRAPIRPEEVGGLAELLTPDGDLRTLPCHLAELGGMDGFFAARLTIDAK